MVVLKLPKTSSRYTDGDNAAFVQRVNNQLATDFRALNRLSPLPCVAKIFDAGTTRLRLPANGELVPASFLVEEFVEGDILAQRHRDKKTLQSGALACPIQNAAEFYAIAEELAAALVEIHRRQIIHGDIWYTNVMRRHSDGKLVYIDFGSAVLRDQFFRASRLASPQQHAFVAPEVKAGYAHGRRSDIFALGALLYCLATGDADPPELNEDLNDTKARVEQRLNATNPTLMRGSVAIAGLIARCLRLKKERRIPTADALLHETRVSSLQLASHLRRTSVRTTLGQIEQATRSIEEAGDHFFAGLLHIRADELLTECDDWEKGLYELGGGHDAIVGRLHMALSLLEPEDEFVTFSRPALWSESNLGVQGRILDMERMLVANGVRVRHVFLVTAGDDNERALMAQISAARRPPEATIGTPVATAEAVYRTVTASERDRLVREGWHEAFIISKGKVTGMDFVYGQNDILRTIRFVRNTKTSGDVSRKWNYERAMSNPLNLSSAA